MSSSKPPLTVSKRHANLPGFWKADLWCKSVLKSSGSFRKHTGKQFLKPGQALYLPFKVFCRLLYSELMERTSPIHENIRKSLQPIPLEQSLRFGLIVCRRSVSHGVRSLDLPRSACTSSSHFDYCLVQCFAWLQMNKLEVLWMKTGVALSLVLLVLLLHSYKRDCELPFIFHNQFVLHQCTRHCWYWACYAKARPR